MDWSGVDNCDVFISCLDSFWRHPFTAEDPLVSKWCNDTFLQIWWRNKLNYIFLDGLRRITSSANVFFWVTYTPFCKLCLKKYVWFYLKPASDKLKETVLLEKHKLEKQRHAHNQTLIVFFLFYYISCEAVEIKRIKANLLLYCLLACGSSVVWPLLLRPNTMKDV